MYSKKMVVIYIFLSACIILFVAYFFISPPQKELYETMNDYFSSNKEHNTIYYKVTDVNGVTSTVHDSGVKPNSLAVGDEFIINVLKKEYNNEENIELDTPSIIEYGRSIFDLKNKVTISIGDIKTMNLYYRIKILYGR